MEVGDELAFRDDFGWRIRKIEKITPTGQIVCGGLRLNPDLSIRGKPGYFGPYRGVLVTDKIRAQIRRQELVRRLKSVE